MGKKLLFFIPIIFLFIQKAILAFKKFNMNNKVKMVSFQIIQNVPTVKYTLTVQVK